VALRILQRSQLREPRGHLNIVKILCSAGCQIDPSAAWVPKCLSKAVEEDDFEITELLLRAGADPTWGGMYELPPFIRAARNGSHRLVDALLQNNPVRYSGLTEWIVRALHMHPPAEDSTTTDSDGLFPRVESALPAAFSTHRTDVVCALLTVLSHFATPTGSDISQWPAVKRILQDVSADQKNAALHTAAKSGLRDAVILLLANGADPNAPDTDTGETPLITVLNWGLELSGCTPPFVSRENIVAILIEDGADVNARGGEEESSLHAALAMRG